MKQMIILALALSATPALAQNAQQTPNEQALMAEINVQQSAKLGCFSTLISTRDDLAKALLKVKGLEEKLPAEDKPK